MSLTNTKQCLGARNDKTSHTVSRNTQHDNQNGDGGNSRFVNSSFIGDAENLISHLSITKDGPRSIQLTKILETIPYLCQDKHYDYLSDSISTNTKLTQEDFLSNHSIKSWHPSKHHVKLGVVNPTIGLNVPSGNSPINSEMVDYTPISYVNLQVPHHSDHNEGLFSRSHEWDELIVDKKSILELILNRCDEATREEIILS